MKEYRVWLEIEEYDDETDEYTTLDAPGSSLRTFPSHDLADQFAQAITDQFGKE